MLLYAAAMGSTGKSGRKGVKYTLKRGGSAESEDTCRSTRRGNQLFSIPCASPTRAELIRGLSPLGTCLSARPSLWPRFASLALDHYHNTQGIKLELTGEVSAHEVFAADGFGVHLGFEANDITGSTKTMFVEIYDKVFEPDVYDAVDVTSGEQEVTFCGIIDPTGTDVEKGCPVCCPPSLLHPKGVKFFEFDK